MTQKEALTILKTGANVFLTGEPGSGKTHLVNEYVAYLHEHDIAPAITASTGIAATHIGGFTIHSWSGIGIRKTLASYDLEMMAMNERLARRIRAARVLIIDEISMLDGKMLDLVNRVCRFIKRNEAPFGGMQVVFVGDFFQLPPVTPEGEPSAQFAFASESWHAAKPVVCYLSEQHRQEDSVFLELLSALRSNALEARHRAHLAGRFAKEDDTKGRLLTKLFPHNADVDRINEARLAELAGRASVFEMRSSGFKTLVEQLKRGCLSPETLTLKKGARVMFTKNNFEAGFVNGTIGDVVEFREGDGVPLVRTGKGTRAAESMDWTIMDGARTLAKITQVPLRLAWALTVHKSQGGTLDAAFMDLSDAFAYGQGYVALSRVRTLSGLYIAGFNERALEVHSEVSAKDGELRVVSQNIQEELRVMPPHKLVELHRNFIRACGGSLVVSGKKAFSVKKKSSPHYITRELLRKKLSLSEMAEARGLTVGTILNHLEKLAASGMIKITRDIEYLKPEQDRFEKMKAAFAAAYKREGVMTLALTRKIIGDDFSYDELRLARLFLEE